MVARSLRDKAASQHERLAPALTPTVEMLLDGPAQQQDGHHQERAGAAVGRPGAGPVRRLVRVLPAQRGRPPGRPQPPAGHRRDGLRRRLLPADPPDRPAVPQGPEQHARRATDSDVGSPWAIGGPEGGHTDIHPDLGTFTDFEDVVHKAHELGMEIALDYALQCSPDHPWVTEHPEWFHHRPDGTIAYAENPPKKYQDIYPINFWPDKEADRKALWDACKEHPRLLDRQGRPHLPSRQPPHQADGVLGVVHRRRAGRAPRRALPRRGVHPTQGDGQARRGRLQPELHVLHVAHRAGGARRVPRGARPRSRRRLHAAELLAEHARHPRRPAAQRNAGGVQAAAASSPPCSRRATASTAATSSSRTSRCRTPTRSTSTARSTRSATRNWDDPRSIAGCFTQDQRTSAAATRRCSGCATSTSTTRQPERHRVLQDLRGRHRRRPHRGEPRPVEHPGVHARPRPRRPSVCRWTGRTRPTTSSSNQSFTWQGPEPYVRLDPYHEVAHVLHLRSLS